MAKRRCRLPRLWLALALLLALPLGARPAGAQGPGFDSNQFTQADAVDTDWTIYQAIPPEFALLAENATFQLYANTDTLAFKVVDKRSGYVWHSGIDVKADGDRLNKTWTDFAQSGLSIDYLDAKAIPNRLSITNAEHTLEKVALPDGFQVNVTFTEAGITIGVAVRLEADGVSVEIPYSGIRETNADFKLGMIYLYAFLGATRTDAVPGYMFIPDGVGSLIRFSAATKAKNMFYGRYYGADLGMISSLPYNPLVQRAFRLSVPVFGMVHGYQQHAFLAVLEQGAPYGEVQAHPAGIITNFNFIYNAFVYNESYFQATNRSGAGVTTVQPATNVFDIKAHYRFLDGADSDYVGMARSYQQYLVDRGQLHVAAESTADIGLRLEFLGGDKQRVLFWDRLIPMTTADQMGAILADLGVANTEVVYYGWQPLGASSMPPTALKLDSRLASAAQLRELAATIAANGGHFSLYLNPQAALRDEGGYSQRSDLAMSITDVNLMGANRNIVNYYFNLDALRQRLVPLSQQVAERLEAGLALDGLSNVLYSDFKRGHVLNRADAIGAYQTLLSDAGGPTGLYAPNDYAFAAMRAYYDMPLSTSGYLYTTDVVPFLPIVFSGYVPTYGPALNFSANTRLDQLRLVDFGVYPAYFVTAEATDKILNTRANWIYTSSYAQWGGAIRDTYAWMNSLLAPVKGQAIVARTVLQPGVVATTYANGRQIVVNYTDQPYTAGRLAVPAQDAVLTEAQP